MSITQNGWTPLITAAASGKYDVVLDLLDSGADVNAHDNVSHCHLRHFLQTFLDMYCMISTCTLCQKVHGSQ